MPDDTPQGLPSGIGAVLDALTSALGFAAGGPFGAVAGVAVSRAVGALAYDLMSARQIHRVQTVLETIADRISEFEAEGRHLREDEEFFTDTDRERATATELGEAVLIAARDAFEEKKLRLLGTFFANVAFEPNVDRLSSHALLSTATVLSYSQMVMLAVLMSPTREELAEGSFGDREPIPYASGFLPVVDQLWDLYRRNLVAPIATPGESHRGYWLSAFEMSPRRTELFANGAALAVMMRLDECDRSDIDLVLNRFNWQLARES